MIRLATATDAYELYKMLQLSFARYQFDSVITTALTETTQSLEHKLNTSYKALLLFEEKTLIGMCLFQINQSTCSFHRFCIHPDYQGKGISKELLYGLEQKAFELGCADLHCESRLENCDYYIRQGYEITQYLDSSSLYVLEKSINTLNKTWQCA